MANKFLGVLGLLALASSCYASVATYSYQPYNTYHVAPAALTYAAPAAAVYHHQPLVYHQAAVATKAVAPVAAVATKAVEVPVVKSVGPVVHAEPVLAKTVVAAPAVPVLKQVEIESSPRYDFSYGVHDSLTGDIKSQVESRDGGNVAGSYSVVDADGFKRTVTYTADDVNGFNAVVERQPILAKVAAVPVVHSAPVAAKVAAAAPVVHAAPAPIAYSSAAVIPPFTAFNPLALQHHYQYFPQAVVANHLQLQPAQHHQEPEQHHQQQPHSDQDQETVEAPAEQQAAEPAPVEYPQQQFLQQGQYPFNQRFPPFPQFENPQQAQPAGSSDDSEVVEARSAPAPVNEQPKESNNNKN